MKERKELWMDAKGVIQMVNHWLPVKEMRETKNGVGAVDEGSQQGLKPNRHVSLSAHIHISLSSPLYNMQLSWLPNIHLFSSPWPPP